MYKRLLAAGLIVCCTGSNRAFSQSNRYPPVSGACTGEAVPCSPDPLVAYRWNHPEATDGLEIYTLQPVHVQSDRPGEADVRDISAIKITGKCNLMFDFGQVNAAWFEFDAEDLEGDIEMSISEYNEPAVFNAGSQHPAKTAAPVRYGNTWRLELNRELYEGVRFAWIHIRRLDKPATITAARLVCQVKPTNYEGSFSCSDTLLTRIWYTGAYDVKLNLLKDYFGAILMERSDRHSWTGDAHTSQAASMVAFGNYDFVKTNLRHTSTQYNGILSYSLYWVLSLMDYYYYTGDNALLDEMLENACHKLDVAYEHYGTNPDLRFYGWDERLGAGFENPSREAQNAYKMLSIQAWNEFGKVMEWAGKKDLAEKYRRYAAEKTALLRENPGWTSTFGVHAAADAVNAGFTRPDEQEALWHAAFGDRLQRMSYSPFNQYFIIRALARLNLYDEALSTVDDCWGGQLRYGGTTFFEVFRSSWNTISRPNDAPVNNQCGYTSLTHPWSAGITKWLSEEILGITPVAPGFSSFLVKPRLSHAVTRVKGAVPTLHGRIEASFDLQTGLCEVTVPPGTTATVCVPKAGLKIKQVTLAGKPFKASREDGDHLYYPNLPEGNYKIQVTYAGKTVPCKEEPTRYTYNPPVEDAQTKGNWKGAYGSKGYILCNYDDSLQNRTVIPDYLEEPVFRLNGNVHWAANTSDPRAPEDRDGVRKIGAFITRDPHACLQTMTIDLPCKSRQNYKVSLYFVDWDTSERRSAIEIFDLEDRKLLAPVHMVRDYSGGKYITYEFDRSVRIRINQVRGVNAALSGIFFD
ncbi:MAG: hypothetical protein LBL57_03870 [Tannerella sp.]|jgi:hypothetical protein|nr:hypothetical protein [Tannerella sp.]